MKRLKFLPALVFLMGFNLTVFSGVAPSHAFMGEYNSTSAFDTAIMATVRQTSEITYKVDNGSTITLMKRELVLGASKTLSSKVKVYGGFNYAFDGEIEHADYDLEEGYAATIGGRYGLVDQNTYAVNCYAQLDYTFEGVYKNPDLEKEYSIDGYGVLVGLLGKYRLFYNFSAYAALEVLALSDFNEERDWQGAEQHDVELENSVGVKLGLFYDQYSWFLRGDFNYGMGTGFGLTGGMKF